MQPPEPAAYNGSAAASGEVDVGTGSLICHRCGFRAREAGVERCPEDGLHLVGEEDHRLSPGDPYLGATLGGRYPILGLAAGDGRPELHYRSRQPLSGREVVLHVFPPAAERTEDHQPLLQAAAAITGLNHPGVVRLLDCGTAQDGTTILVWEQVHSSSLAELFARGGFTCRELVQLAVMVLDALAEAHGKGIPHGDLRPESILLPGGGEPGADVPWIKIRSFGLSKLLRLAGGGQPAVAPAGATAAPEPDCAADLRALSALLRQGLSGQVADGAVGFPAGLLEILERALAPAPETGFASAREMGAALEDLSLGAEADRPLPPV
ncbi:MAG: hypothetical protein FJ125_17840, partial [Deltaproteobacteria bacterium]|nr:hypothetical protein [Deltaproteobacteria bacterium]